MASKHHLNPSLLPNRSIHFRVVLILSVDWHEPEITSTAWNLGALKLEEIDTYLQSRGDHGFNAVMFALNFSPQAVEKNAYGEPAYVGADKTDLNPAYFATCDQIIKHAAARGLYVVIYPMWAGEKAGTMNFYTPAQLELMGRELGNRYGGVPNVIFSAGGEATPHYIDVERVNAMGRGLKEGCAGRVWAETDPRAAAGYAASFPSGPLRQQVITASVSVWISQDLPAAAAWINRFQPGPDFDSVVAQIARAPALIDTDTSTALNWAESISDDAGRSQCISLILAHWAERDPVAVVQYVTNTLALSSDQRIALLAHFHLRQ